MSTERKDSLGATATDHARLVAACRELALIGLAAALAGRADRANPIAPRRSPTVALDVTAGGTSVPPTELRADAIGRIVRGLENDAGTPVGNALRALDAKLRDPDASVEATRQ